LTEILGVGTQNIREEDARSSSELACLGVQDRRSLRPALERDGPDDHLVVDGSQGSADEGPDPEDPLQTMIATHVIPTLRH
jgi:hypothetical protein